MDAAHQHHHRAGAHDEDGAGEVGLDAHQGCQDNQQHRIGGDAVAERLHTVLFLGDAVGKIDHHRQLCDLRGLELQRSTWNAQPAGGVVPGNGQGVARNNHQDQQNDGQIQQRLCKTAEPLIVDLANEEHGRHAHDGEHALADKVGHGVLAVRLVIGGGEAGGQQHHQAHAGQQHHQDEEGQVNGPLGQFPALLLQLPPALLALLPGQGLFPTHGSPAGRRGFFLPYHTASLLSGSVDLAALRSGPAQSAQNRPWTPR